MQHEALKGLLMLGLFFSGLSLCSLIYLPPDVPEFALSLCSLGIGLTILGAAAFAARYLR